MSIGVVAASDVISGGGGGSAYDAAVLADTPSAYYKGAEASGTTMLDSSGSSRNGVYSGTVSLGQPGIVTGDSDTCPVWTAGQGLATYDAAWLSSNVFSVDAIFRLTDLSGGSKTIMSRYASTGFVDSRWSIRADGTTLNLYTFFGSGFSTLAIGTIAINTKYHVAFTFDTFNAKTYLNGVAGAAGGRNMNTANTDFRVANGGGGEFAIGKVCKVAHYPTTLSAARIAAHAAAA